MLKHIPNALTLTRLILAPVIAWLMLDAGLTFSFYIYTPEGRMAAYFSGVADTLALVAALFIVAALTDFFDGMIARAFNAHSKFGRIIDPIADKALVGLPLIIIAISGRWENPLQLVVVIASAVIVIRDLSMTAIRFMSPDGEGARVSSLAKIKTALELVVVGSYLVGTAIGAHLQVQALLEDPTNVFIPSFATFYGVGWIALLVITAALSAYTGWQYLKPAKKS